MSNEISIALLSLLQRPLIWATFMRVRINPHETERNGESVGFH